jgi:hypothetical protein
MKKKQVEQELERLERQLLRVEVRKSPVRVKALLDDDFHEFASTGRIYNKSQIIKALRTGPTVRCSLQRFKALRISPDVALTTFRYVKSSNSGQGRLTSLRSSLWKRMDGRWRMIFHQGTLCATTARALTSASADSRKRRKSSRARR